MAGWLSSMQLGAARMRTRRPPVPWWSQPAFFFFVPFTLFCLIFLWSFVQMQQQLPSHFDGLSPQDKATIRCNPTARLVVTCAHRGNAAELLAGRDGNPQQAASVLQQMQLLWQAGVTCFDMDVVQLKDLEFIVGHPADLAAHVTAAALPPDSTNIYNSSSSKQPAHITADQLHTFNLQELRTAGLTEAAAPTLRSLLAQFKQLLGTAAAANSSSSLSSLSSLSSSSSSLDIPAAATAAVAGVRTVQAAAAARSWVSTPLISLEPKGPAATDAGAFLEVARLVAASGLSSHAVLWMRQMPPVTAAAAAGGGGSGAGDPRSSSGSGSGSSDSSSNAGTVTVTELARSITSSLDSSVGGSSGVRPLLGLIVTDMLLQEKHLARLKGDAAQLTPAVLAAAGGLDGSGNSGSTGSSGSSGSSSANFEEGSGAAKVLQAFDVLAPSIKLPAGVLEAFVAAKPCLAWTLEGEAHARKAMWLGIDVAITNEPIAQLAVIQQDSGSLCNARHG